MTDHYISQLTIQYAEELPRQTCDVQNKSVAPESTFVPVPLVEGNYGQHDWCGARSTQEEAKSLERRSRHTKSYIEQWALTRAAFIRACNSSCQSATAWMLTLTLFTLHCKTTATRSRSKTSVSIQIPFRPGRRRCHRDRHRSRSICLYICAACKTKRQTIGLLTS